MMLPPQRTGAPRNWSGALRTAEGRRSCGGGLRIGSGTVLAQPTRAPIAASSSHCETRATMRRLKKAVGVITGFDRQLCEPILRDGFARITKEIDMPSARERANNIALELRETRMQMKAAEIKARQLTDELAQAMVEARSEAEAERRIVTYPTGRYECASYGQVTLFTEPTRELPACANCGNRKWVGH